MQSKELISIKNVDFDNFTHMWDWKVLENKVFLKN